MATAYPLQRQHQLFARVKKRKEGRLRPYASIPRVSIIIPCRNEGAHIENCLRTALSLDAPLGGMEIIVADGMSDDGTRELLAAAIASISRAENESRNSVAIRVIDNPGQSTPKGLNAAIAASCGEVIVRFDAHTEYAPDYITQCIAVLQKTGADNVGGPARTKARTYVQKAVAAAYHSRFSVGGARFHDTDYEGFVDTVTYGCWPRVTFTKFGLFDEDLVRNQDDEHNLRITRGGGTVYQSPKITSWYSPRGSLRALFHQYLQYGYWKVRVVQKHRLPASWRHLIPGGFVLTLLGLSLTSSVASIGSWASGRPVGGSLVVPWSFGSLVVLLLTYATALVVASIHTASRNEWRLLPILPAVFSCYHLGYGIGFLRGIVDFVILRRHPAQTFTRLTRNQGSHSKPER